MERIDELIDAVTAELEVDTTVLLDDTVSRRQLAIDRLADLATALSLQNLVDLDRRPFIEAVCGQNTAGWIALEDRIAPGLAHRKVRTARRLADRLAETNAAWTAGLINAEHVRVLNDAAANLRIGDRICALQGDLIRLAGELTFAHWRQMVIYLVRELDEDGVEAPRPSSPPDRSWPPSTILHRRHRITVRQRRLLLERTARRESSGGEPGVAD